MRTRVWCTSLVLASLAVACGDQPTEVVPERELMTQGPGVIALATSSSDDGLSISTDKDDYQPGDTVHFTGAGWQPFDVLDIVLTDEPLTHDPHTWSVNVGENGSFHDSTYVVDVGDIDVTFTLTATSRATGRSLTVVFTDNANNIVMAVPGVAPTPFSPNQASSAGIKDATTITLQNGSGVANNISLRVRSGTAIAGALVKEFAEVSGINTNAQATFVWDGKNTNGTMFVGDGIYTARITTQAAGGTEHDIDDKKRTIVVDNTNPMVAVDAIAGGTSGVEMTITGTASDATAGLEKVEVTILRASDNDVLATGNATNTGTSFSTWSFTYTPGEASAQKANAKATDNAGNNTTSNVQTFEVTVADAQAPTIDCTVPDQAVWYGSNVTVNCTASDDGSGLANPTDATFSLSTTVADGIETDNAQTGSREVCDNDGNCATAGPYTFKVDRKDPVVSCGAADGAWHATDASIACTASDGGSGLANAGDANFNLVTNVPNGTETANALTDSRNVLDAVGNSATAGPVGGNMIDKKAPAISCGVADGAWHATDVSIACTASDGGSGLANAPADASFNLMTNVASGTETNNALTGTRNVLDAVGNSATAGPIGGNMIDKKGPVVTLTCPVAPVVLGAPATAGWTATDGGSLVAPGFASGNIALETSSVGPKTATAPVGTSKDNVDNNSLSVSCAYSVVFDFHGFFTPVDNNGVLNVANSGQAIPLKWELRDYLGNPVTNLSSAKVTVENMNCGLYVTGDAVEEYAAGSSGLQNHGDGSYQFNWKTPTSYSKSCKTMKLDLGEGTPRMALFQFRK